MTTTHDDLLAPVDGLVLRKARGAFFTPPALANFVSRWAIRAPSDRILEPSCGEAAFLVAAAMRLDELGASKEHGSTTLEGIEIHPPSARAAAELVSVTGRSASIEVADFFTVTAARRFDAVIGNPPYVRYQDHVGAARVASRQAALRGGVGLTALASMWAAATVHAAEFLRPGGRMGLVLPAELLSVNYAADVRRYLMERFGRVRLVMFTERVFPDVQEEVVLLLAEDALAEGGTDHCELHQVRSVDELSEEDHSGYGLPHRWRPAHASAKWTPALLSAAALNEYTPLTDSEHFAILHEWGDTTLGAVTGRNNYFAISPARAGELKLKDSETITLSPPGSRHLRGLSLNTSALNSMGDEGLQTLLFRPGLKKRQMSAGAQRYLLQGEHLGVDQAYKCRVRSPWWQVPINAPADLLLTYMNADTPRLTTNLANAVHLNSVHGVYLHPEHKEPGKSLLPIASLNTVTLLGAELVGRSYGGGMLKVEPSEADQLPLPSPSLVAHLAPGLREIRRSVRDALKAGDLLGAVRIVDQLVLRDYLRLSEAQHSELVAAQALMSARRLARAANPSRTQ
ncbi:HsdM family class I SAM-dependent methyltransferase [Gordonia sp. SL306]|uniref:HsdM family class I SAM-dependent methyltransferase n=1 Tax=Gordonia sp. SL306 TaxID=2995145 RepID=UPI00226DC20A|nr:N-6 DNA methylase [Gordonia sp. SL306]WAC57554.1 N-6 DNA methylase [Gordonia sp. SL306]